METSPDEMLDRGTALPLPTSYEEDTSANENSDDYMINLLADVCTENAYEAEPKRIVAATMEESSDDEDPVSKSIEPIVEKKQFKKFPDELQERLHAITRDREVMRSKLHHYRFVSENINQQARLFERNLRLTVVNLQQKLKIAAKSMLDEYKLQCKDQKLSAVEEASAMIKDQMQVINQLCNVARCHKSDEDTKTFEDLCTKLSDMKIAGVPKVRVEDNFVVDFKGLGEHIDSICCHCTDEMQATIPKELPSIDIAEGKEVEIFVSSKLESDCSFWVLPTLPDEVVIHLHTISNYIRDNYLSDTSWQTYAASGRKPTNGMVVYALSDIDKNWYRGVIEDDNSVRDRYAVRFIDYGHLEYLPSSELLPVEGSHTVFDGWSPQAVRCCLFESPAEDTNYEARWLFNSAVKDTEVHCTFGKKVTLSPGAEAYQVTITIVDHHGNAPTNLNDLVIDKLAQKKSVPKSTIVSSDIRLMESGSNKLTVINAVINKTTDEKSTDPDTGALNSELQSTLNEQPKTALEVLNEVMSRPPPASPETDEAPAQAPAPHIPSLIDIPVAPPEVRNQGSIETGTKSEQPVKHNSVASQLITLHHPAMNNPKSQDLNTAITNLSKLPPACVLTESEMIEIDRERPHSQSPPSDASSLVLGAGITSSPFNLLMSPNVDNFANIGQRPYTAHSPSTYTPILPPVDAMRFPPPDLVSTLPTIGSHEDVNHDAGPANH